MSEPDLPGYTTSRTEEFERVHNAVRTATVLASPEALVVAGDSLEALRSLPNRSVSLIVTDPPYHSTKKANIRGDRDFEQDEHYLAWMADHAREWSRVLKLSGTVYVFCSSIMAARLETTAASFLRPINSIVWTKPNEPGFDGWKGKMRKSSLRTWYPHSERILVFEQGTFGRAEASRRSPMGSYLLDCRHKAGLTMTELTEMTGEFGRINRGGAVANWEAGRNIPSRDQYSKLCNALTGTGEVTQMLAYEDLIRPMNLNGDSCYTDVWDFPSVRPYRGKHPAQKPLDMLRHIILASSYQHDLVLDCFAGSGSTGVAALRTGRRTVCVELDDRWAKTAADNIKNAIPDGPDLKAISDSNHLQGVASSEPKLF